MTEPSASRSPSILPANTGAFAPTEDSPLAPAVLGARALEDRLRSRETPWKLLLFFLNFVGGMLLRGAGEAATTPHPGPGAVLLGLLLGLLCSAVVPLWIVVWGNGAPAEARRADPESLEPTTARRAGLWRLLGRHSFWFGLWIPSIRWFFYLQTALIVLQTAVGLSGGTGGAGR
jgi:hypothetical protein